MYTFEGGLLLGNLATLSDNSSVLCFVFCILCFVFCCNDLIVGLWNAIHTIRPTVHVAVVATSRLLQCVYVHTYVGVQYIH